MLTVTSLPRVEIARLRRPALQASGWLVMGLGVLALPIPGPVSTPLVVMGGLLVLRNSVSARRHYVRARDHAPRLVRPLFGRFDAWRHRHRHRVHVRVPAVLAAANDLAANDRAASDIAAKDRRATTALAGAPLALQAPVGQA
ncbi:PGPGW domain-containing protein [Nitrospirillum iridis]|uniref:Transmembrane protein (PGPGW) n=1 Tax=Nitrospirillum iridis TaxID=765888 RepID=A0A7X0EAM9_9PROT|nr:PGPGW domain-containing protein [Nitrospirillum iridis]MBB6249732.1 hypothetical protein [Nitrospirillum iridis]